MSTLNQPPFPLTSSDLYTEAEIKIINMNKALKAAGVRPSQKFDRREHAQGYNAWRGANAVSVDTFDDDGIIVSSESRNIERLADYEERCRAYQERKFNERVSKRQRWSRIYNWWRRAFCCTVSVVGLFAFIWFYVEGIHSK